MNKASAVKRCVWQGCRERGSVKIRWELHGLVNDYCAYHGRIILTSHERGTEVTFVSRNRAFTKDSSEDVK